MSGVISRTTLIQQLYNMPGSKNPFSLGEVTETTEENPFKENLIPEDISQEMVRKKNFIFPTIARYILTG